MKRLIVITLLLCSCAESVTFIEPQPTNRRNLRGFKKSMQGSYNTDDHRYVSFSVINARTLIAYQRLDSTVDKDSGLESPLIGDTTVLVPLADSLKNSELSRTAIWMRFKPNGDSVRIFGFVIDTLINLDRGDVLRRYRGHLVLNRQFEPGKWRVTLLRTSHDSLTIASIGTQQLQKAWSVLGVTDSSKVFKPTRRQFKKLIKARVFAPGVKSKRTTAEPTLN